MPVKSYSTLVTMPDSSTLEVSYYCMDNKLDEKEREKQTQLYIQLHDCICSIRIERAICRQRDALERIVHNKVLNTKGHLC